MENVVYTRRLPTKCPSRHYKNLHKTTKMSYVLRCLLFSFLKLDKSIKFADHKHYCEMNLVIGFVILEWDMRDVDTVTSKCKVHSQSTTNS